MDIPTLRIGIAPWNPWVVYGSGNDSSVRGVALEIYDVMKKSRIFNYNLLSGATYGGALGSDGKWTGAMGDMIRNETDLAGPIFMSEERASAVKFAYPLDFSKLVIISGLVPANKNPYLIFGIFSFKVWSLILLSIFAAAGAACLIYSILPSLYTKKKVEAFLRFLWMFEASLLGKEFGANSKLFLRHIWSAPSFKFLQGIWIMTCLVLTYTYQGIIVSTYAADKMKPRFETLDDFLADTSAVVGTFENSYPILCLSKLANTRLDSLWVRIQQNLLKPVRGVPPWLDSVEEGKSAYLADNLYSKFLIGERFRKTGKCNIRVTPIDVCASFLGLATRKGLPASLLRSFNEGILRFNEGGLSSRHMAEAILFYEVCTHQSVSATQPLDISDLIGAFTVLGTGLALSIIYFALELVANYRVCSRLRKKSQSESEVLSVKIKL